MFNPLDQRFGLELPPLQLLILNARLSPRILLLPSLQNPLSLIDQSASIVELLFGVIAQIEQF